MYWKGADQAPRLVSAITPGRLIGDLSIIINEKRPLAPVALEDSIFLRIGAIELMAISKNDAMVATSLMRSVAGHMSGTVDALRELQLYSSKRGIDFSDFDQERSKQKLNS